MLVCLTRNYPIHLLLIYFVKSAPSFMNYQIYTRMTNLGVFKFDNSRYCSLATALMDLETYKRVHLEV